MVHAPSYVTVHGGVWSSELSGEMVGLDYIIIFTCPGLLLQREGFKADAESQAYLLPNCLLGAVVDGEVEHRNTEIRIRPESR